MIYHNLNLKLGKKSKTLSKVGADAMITPVGKVPAFNAKKHLANRALLVYAPTEMIVFTVGAQGALNRLMAMRKAGAEYTQCLLLVPDETRKVVFDTMYAWSQWGGVSLPLFENLEKTLRYLDEHITSGNYPLEADYLNWEIK